METARLKLFLCGDGPLQMAKRASLEAICKNHFKGQCEIEVIDVLKEPLKAETYQVIATPTVIRMDGESWFRVIGDISDTKDFLNALGFL